MAERRPIVLISGELQELPVGDILPGAGGLQNNYAATTAPAVTDDSGAGYAVGSEWIDVTNDNSYVCVDASVGAAVWQQTNGAGGGGSTTFTDLTDTPANFTGQALKAVRVNAGETALEYIDFSAVAGSAMVQTEITVTAYSTVNDDFAGNVIRRMNNAATQTVTVEPSMTGGQPVTFIRVGAGAVSFAAGAGVTIHSAGGNLSIADRYGSATLVPDATTADTYYLIGNLTT